MSNLTKKPETGKTTSPSEAHSIKAFATAGVAMAILLILIVALLFKPGLVMQAGLVGKVWYVVTVLLGLACAVTLFTLFRSYARYSGKAMNGTLEMGGPGVLMLVIVVLGFALPPQSSSKFDVTVFLRLDSADAPEALKGAKLSMDLGADRRVEVVEAKGLVRFVGIPAEMLGRQVPVALQAPLLTLSAGKAATLELKSEAVYLDVVAQTWNLVGQVLDEKGQGLAGAEVTMAGHKTHSDTSGRFTFTLNTQLPAAKRSLEVKLQGFSPWRNPVAAGAEDVQVQLIRAK